MKKLVSILKDMKLTRWLLTAELDEDFDKLGFKMYGKMSDVPEYGDKAPERAWIMYKELPNDEMYIVAIGDQGNGYFSLLLNDVPVEELLNGTFVQELSNDCSRTCLNCKHKCVANTDEVICDYSEEKVAEDDTCEDFEFK